MNGRKTGRWCLPVQNPGECRPTKMGGSIMFRYRLAAATSFGLCFLVLGSCVPQSTSQPGSAGWTGCGTGLVLSSGGSARRQRLRIRPNNLRERRNGRWNTPGDGLFSRFPARKVQVHGTALRNPYQPARYPPARPGDPELRADSMGSQLGSGPYRRGQQLYCPDLVA